MIIPPKKVLRCLYSSQLTKKKKTWFDGQAKLDEKTGTLYLHKWSDAIQATVGGPIDMICPPRQLLDAFLTRKVLELEMENHLVSVDGVNDEEEQQPREQMEIFRQRNHHPLLGKRPRVFKPPERISRRTYGPPTTTMYHVDDPVPPFHHFDGREAEAIHHHHEITAAPHLRVANNGEDETEVNGKENPTNNGFLSSSVGLLYHTDLSLRYYHQNVSSRELYGKDRRNVHVRAVLLMIDDEQMVNPSSHHIMNQQTKTLSSAMTPLGYQQPLRLRNYLGHNENQDQMLTGGIGGERQTMPNQEQYRTTITQGVAPQTTNGNEKLITGHYPSRQGNTTTHHHVVDAAAVLSNDQLAGHRSSPFVRSASDILSLLEGGGEIGSDDRKEDRIEDYNKRQGHGLDGGTGCGGGGGGGGGAAAAADALPVKTHKEERSKGEWDSLHEIDEVVSTTSVVTSEKNGWPQFGHSRPREELVKRSEKGIVPHSVTAGSSNNQYRDESGSLLQVHLSDFSGSSQYQ